MKTEEIIHENTKCPTPLKVASKTGGLHGHGQLLGLGFSAFGFWLRVFGCPTWDTGLGLLAVVGVYGGGVGQVDVPLVHRLTCHLEQDKA